MLSRSLLRSVRTTALRPTPISLGITSNQWMREYAKDNRPKPKKPLVLRNAAPVPDITESPESATSSNPPSVSSSSKSSQEPNDYSEKQPEFQTPASPSKNTAPQPPPTFSAAKEAPETSEPATSEYSKEQTEFKTSASPKENTAPQPISQDGDSPLQEYEKQLEHLEQLKNKNSTPTEQDKIENDPDGGKEDAPSSDPQSPTSAIDPDIKTTGQPLPDLRQGLPSTIDYELRTAASKARGAKGSILKLAEDPSAEGGGMGDLPASAYVSSADRRREKWRNWFGYAAFGMILVSPVYLGRNWETEEEEKEHPEAPSGFGFKMFFQRIMARTNDWMGYYTEPAFTKLLPDITEPAYAREYTLVLNLEDLLIHSEWTTKHGWRLAKRPGLDYFLRYLQQYYELVIWTEQPYNIAEPVLAKLDPYHLCQPLFREATVYSKGEHIKDLSFLNRDLSKVIVIDTNPRAVQRQPENAIILKKFEGNPTDKELVSMIPFLEYIPAMRTKDVREVIKAFDGSESIPLEYARREAIQRKRFEARLAEERKKRPKSAFGWVTDSLGIKPMPQFEGEITFAEALAQGKMIQDIYRERGQREYERFDKLVQTEGPKWLAEEAAMAKKMQEEMMKNMNPLTKLGLQPSEAAPTSAPESGQK